MTITYRQHERASDTRAGTVATTVQLAQNPLKGSELIAVVAVLSDNGVTNIAQTGSDWNLLYENAGDNADERNGSVLRVQIWGAFDIEGGDKDVVFSFSGGTTKRGIVVVEYTGDVFLFSNPADRVVGAFGTTPGGGPGDGVIQSGPSGATREGEQLMIGAAAIDQSLNIFDPAPPFAIRQAVEIGSPAFGRLSVLDAMSSDLGVELEVNHDGDPANTEWVALATALLGNVQIPVDPATPPVAPEPVTEFEDYSSDGINKLASQYRART